MRILIAVLCLAALAPTAAARADVIPTQTRVADVLSFESGVVGPALVGGTVVWGERTLEGGYRLVTPHGVEGELPSGPRPALWTDGAKVMVTAGGLSMLAGPLGAVATVPAMTPPGLAAGDVELRDGAVVDRHTGAERYRPQIPADWVAIDLQADGTVLAERHGPGSGPVFGVTSPAAPALRRIAAQNEPYLAPVTRGGAERRRVLAGDRIVSIEHRDLVVRDLDGKPAGGVAGLDPQPPLAFDGTTVAWAARRCGAAIVVTWKLGEPSPAGPWPGPCVAAVARPGRLTPKALLVDLACPASVGVGGCGTSVTITLRGHRRAGHPVGRTVSLDTLGPLAMLPGEVRTLTAPITGGDRRYLRRFPWAGVRLGVRVQRLGRGGVMRTFTRRVRVER